LPTGRSPWGVNPITARRKPKIPRKILTGSSNAPARSRKILLTAREIPDASREVPRVPVKSQAPPAKSVRLPPVQNRSRKIPTSAREIPDASREIMTPPAKSQVVPAKSCAPATESQAAVCVVFACSYGVQNPFQHQRRGIVVEPAPKRKFKLHGSGIKSHAKPPSRKVASNRLGISAIFFAPWRLGVKSVGSDAAFPKFLRRRRDCR
jgi:hypothetical protein